MPQTAVWMYAAAGLKPQAVVSNIRMLHATPSCVVAESSTAPSLTGLATVFSG